MLFEFLKAQGCQSSYSSVARYVRCLKEAQELPKRRHYSSSSQSQHQSIKFQQHPLTPRRATWLVLRRPEHRGEGDEQRLAKLQFQCPTLEKAITLAPDFAQMVRNRQAEQFNS